MRFVEIALAHDAGTWAAMPITRAVRTPNQTWSGARWFCARGRRSSRARRSPTTTGGNISTSFSNRPDANAPSAWRDGASGAARRRHDDARALAAQRRVTARSSAPLARQAPPLGAGELAQLLLAHRFHHLARGALEARLRALAALGRERRARGHLLFLRSGRHDILLATDVRRTFGASSC